MLFGHRKSLIGKNLTTFPDQWIMTKELKINDNWWHVVLVYNRNGIHEIKDKLEEEIEKKLNLKNLLLGDWNCRIGTLGDAGEVTDTQARNAKDTLVNTEGKNG